MTPSLLLLLLVSTGLVNCRPKSNDGNVVLNDILTGTGSPVPPPAILPGGSRPRIEQPFMRHALTSESRHSEGLTSCRKAAKCQALKNTTCLTSKLPYSHTSLDLITDSHSQEDIQVNYLTTACLDCFNLLIIITSSIN